MTDQTSPIGRPQPGAWPQTGLRRLLAMAFSRENLSARAGDLILTAALAAPAVWMAGYLFPPINHDAAVLLDVARRWLGGAQLYTDVIDVNTPAVFILHTAPVLLARLTGVPASTLLTLCVIVAVGVSFWLSRRVLDLGPLSRQPLTAALLPVMLLFVLAVLPNDMFGQREHIMLVLTTPYLLMAGERANGEPPPYGLRFVIALMAGIGYTLKPHFLATPLLVELYVAWHRGLRASLSDLVPWLIAGVSGAHLAFALLVTPQYFTFLVPLAMGEYSALGDGDSWDVLTGSLIAPTVLMLVPLTVAANLMLRSRLAQALSLCAVGAVISAVIQGKGWAYQALPALALTLLLAAVVIAKTIDRFLPVGQSGNRLPVAVLTAVVTLLFFYQAALFSPPFRNQRDFEDSIAGRLTRIIEQYADNKKVLILSPGIYPHFPALNYAGATMTMRFESMWVLQGVYAGCGEFAPLYNPPEAMGKAEQFVFRSVPEDFAKQKPSLVIADRIAGIPRCQASEFNYLDYFLRNPLFAKKFANYSHLMDFDRYAIYKRN